MSARRFWTANGRRVLFGRLSEGRYGYIQRASGWSGIMSLPMKLSMCEKGDLLLNPVEELAALRRNRGAALRHPLGGRFDDHT